MKHLSLSLGFLLSIFVPVISLGQAIDPKSVYRNSALVTVPNITIPTVIEVPLTGGSSQVAVFDDTKAEFVPSLYKLNTGYVSPKSITTLGSETSNLDVSTIQNLYDDNYGTFFEFDVPENRRGGVVLTVNYPKPVSVNALELALSQSVALPTKVAIKSKLGNAYKPVLVDYVPQSYVIDFPSYTSDSFEVTLEYGQPLRINELKFTQTNVVTQSESVRFLALPQHEYKLFSNPVYIVPLNLAEAGDLRDDRDVLKVSKVSFSENIFFKEPDTDKDGVSDLKDNCVTVSNVDQKDENNNGQGDICDDYDKDGRINSIDNCVNDPNQDQLDTDRDGKGDRCDMEESRITEKYPFLVWGAILFSALVFVAMFYMVARKGGPQN